MTTDLKKILPQTNYFASTVLLCTYETFIFRIKTPIYGFLFWVEMGWGKGHLAPFMKLTLCLALGSPNVQENEFVSSLPDGGGMVWVGAARMHGAKNGAWAWDDQGVRVNFTNWEDGEVGSNEEDKDDESPGGGDDASNAPGGGCLALHGERGAWVERPCSHRLPFICQIRLTSR